MNYKNKARVETLPDQFLGQVRADKAIGTGNQNSFHARHSEIP
jgi:hypothetical protein